jgi:HTH-type transcriptional regulator, sugar sensing transcriptional regulator
VREQATAQLVELGLTRNESLAWLCLLEAEEPLGLTGYEVAARSGIPRSAVYGVLRKLAEAGAAFPTGEKPARYAPVPPRDFLTQVRRQTETRLDALATNLQQLPSRTRPEPIWIVSAYGDVLERLDEMIRGAKTSVALSVWARELEAIRPALDSLPPSVHRVLHSIDPIPNPPDHSSTWVDAPPSDDHKVDWSHKVICIVDGAEALIGGAEPDVDNQAVVTRNPALVDIATNHIILDVTLIARRTERDCGDAVGPLMRPHLATNGSRAK